MQEDKKYPIYSFSLKWSEKCKPGEYSKENGYGLGWSEGLPNDRFWNSTHFYKMYREEQSLEELNKYALEVFNKMVSKEKYKNRDVDIENPKIEVKFKENETWLLTWFAHETFDEGQTDEEALQSFERFVQRKEEINKKSQYETGEDVYCLMGAKDRWRWRAGVKEDGKTRCDDTPAPCRCIFCKKQGLIRITH